jgi:hypothetical protein
MLEHITPQVLFYVLALILSNAATVKWIRRDIDKHEVSLDRLVERMNIMMTKKEIAALVEGVIHPISTSMDEVKTSMTSVSQDMSEVTVSVARMDERMKIRHNTFRGTDDE